MFPHKITVFNQKEDGTYSRDVIDYAFWQGANSVSDGKDNQHSSNIVVILPKGKYNVSNGSIVVKGIVDSITTKRELEPLTMEGKCITVVGITTNDCGTNIDNIVLAGN